MSLAESFKASAAGGSGISYCGEEMYDALKADPECAGHWETWDGKEFLFGVRVIKVHSPEETQPWPRPHSDQTGVY